MNPTHILEDGTRIFTGNALHTDSEPGGATIWQVLPTGAIIIYPGGRVAVEWNPAAAISQTSKGAVHHPTRLVNGIPTFTAETETALRIRGVHPDGARIVDIGPDGELIEEGDGSELLKELRGPNGETIAREMNRIGDYCERTHTETTYRFVAEILLAAAKELQRPPSWDELRHRARAAYEKRSLQWDAKGRLKKGNPPPTWQETNFKKAMHKMGFFWLLAND